MTDNFWILSDDAATMDRENILVSQIEGESDFWAVDLWNPASEIKQSARLAYKLESGRIDKLWSYDYYPGTASLPVVSERMKSILQENFSADEVKFHQCEIRDSSANKITAWATVPLVCRWCIDRERSDVDWFIPSLKPEEVFIQRSRYVVWQQSCMQSSNIVRVREYKAVILVSDFFRRQMVSINPKGMAFLKELSTS